jgi:hypothetical protein
MAILSPLGLRRCFIAQRTGVLSPIPAPGVLLGNPRAAATDGSAVSSTGALDPPITWPRTLLTSIIRVPLPRARCLIHLTCLRRMSTAGLSTIQLCLFLLSRPVFCVTQHRFGAPTMPHAYPIPASSWIASQPLIQPRSPPLVIITRAPTSSHNRMIQPTPFFPQISAHHRLSRFATAVYTSPSSR